MGQIESQDTRIILRNVYCVIVRDHKRPLRFVHVTRLELDCCGLLMNVLRLLT